MDITTFMIAVYCLIEDSLPPYRLRKGGPQPTLRDSEVLMLTTPVSGKHFRLF
jgi:hypothetical protein